MANHYLLARLGGADAEFLADEEIASQAGETARFTAMACILLTTAAVACLSMFFALHTAVMVSTGWSVVFALAWGVAIINIDRFLIITMNGTRGKPARLAVAVLFRLLLAAIISIVVATPIVLRVFASDIQRELKIVQQQQSAAYRRNIPNTADGAQLAADNQRIANLTATARSEQATVTSDTAIYKNALATAAAAKKKYICELGGVTASECDTQTSGKTGDGPLAQGDYAIYMNDLALAAEDKSELTAATQALDSTQRMITSLQRQAGGLRDTISGLIAGDNTANARDTGLLDQIHALLEASDSDPTLAWAHWIVTALFFVIEILPVSIKCLLLIGSQTPYEQILEKRGEAAVRQAAVQLDARTEVARLRARHRHEIEELEAQAEHEARQARLRGNHAVTSDREWWR
jgi:uncharacterized protein DUF4407